jgi:hypothetical protein
MTVWTFGGVDREGAAYDELWRGELVQDAKQPHYRFSRVKYADGPESRSGALLIPDASGGRLILMGGVNDQGWMLNDVWIFDLMSAKWTRISIKTPETLGLYGADYESSGSYAYVLGGLSQKGDTEELWRFELKSFRFEKFQLNKEEPVKASFGGNTYMNLEGNTLHFYEVHSGGIRNDVSTLDLGSGHWLKF